MADQPTDPGPGKRIDPYMVAAPPVDAQMLTLGEVAYVLRVSVTTVRRMIGDGQITSIPDQRRTPITREAIREFLGRAESFKRPPPEVVARIEAKAKARDGRRTRARVVADSDTGKDTFGMDEPPKPA